VVAAEVKNIEPLVINYYLLGIQLSFLLLRGLRVFGVRSLPGSLRPTHSSITSY